MGPSRWLALLVALGSYGGGAWSASLSPVCSVGNLTSPMTVSSGPALQAVLGAWLTNGSEPCNGEILLSSLHSYYLNTTYVLPKGSSLSLATQLISPLPAVVQVFGGQVFSLTGGTLLVNQIIFECTASSASAPFIKAGGNSILTFTQVTLSGFTLQGLGEVVAVDGSAVAEFLECTFRASSVGVGAFFNLNTPATIGFQDCRFEDIVLSSAADLVYMAHGSTRFVGCQFKGMILTGFCECPMLLSIDAFFWMHH
jgi:hypothetical protein